MYSIVLSMTGGETETYKDLSSDLSHYTTSIITRYIHQWRIQRGHRGRTYPLPPPHKEFYTQDRDTLLDQSVKYSNRTVTACSTNKNPLLSVKTSICSTNPWAHLAM